MWRGWREERRRSRRAWGRAGPRSFSMSPWRHSAFRFRVSLIAMNPFCVEVSNPDRLISNMARREIGRGFEFNHVIELLRSGVGSKMLAIRVAKLSLLPPSRFTWRWWFLTMSPIIGRMLLMSLTCWTLRLALGFLLYEGGFVAVLASGLECGSLPPMLPAPAPSKS